MKPMTKRLTQLTVLPEGEPIFSEMATQITIEDEATGEYVKVKQMWDSSENGTIAISPEDWPILRDAIDDMIFECRKEDA